jgi:hypothetical protein
MMCYCYNDYRYVSYSMYVGGGRSEETINDYLYFKAGNYYEHLGAREMKNENGKIVGFGKLENWKKYFLEPHEDRDRKLKLLEI